jgi:hypothetical protein
MSLKCTEAPTAEAITIKSGARSCDRALSEVHAERRLGARLFGRLIASPAFRPSWASRHGSVRALDIYADHRVPGMRAMPHTARLVVGSAASCGVSAYERRRPPVATRCMSARLGSSRRRPAAGQGADWPVECQPGHVCPRGVPNRLAAGKVSRLSMASNVTGSLCGSMPMIACSAMRDKSPGVPGSSACASMRLAPRAGPGGP